MPKCLGPYNFLKLENHNYILHLPTLNGPIIINSSLWLQPLPPVKKGQEVFWPFLGLLLSLSFWLLTRRTQCVRNIMWALTASQVVDTLHKFFLPKYWISLHKLCQMLTLHSCHYEPGISIIVHQLKQHAVKSLESRPWLCINVHSWWIQINKVFSKYITCSHLLDKGSLKQRPFHLLYLLSILWWLVHSSLVLLPLLLSMDLHSEAKVRKKIPTLVTSVCHSWTDHHYYKRRKMTRGVSVARKWLEMFWYTKFSKLKASLQPSQSPCFSETCPIWLARTLAFVKS